MIGPTAYTEAEKSTWIRAAIIGIIAFAIIVPSLIFFPPSISIWITIVASMGSIASIPFIITYGKTPPAPSTYYSDKKVPQDISYLSDKPSNDITLSHRATPTALSSSDKTQEAKANVSTQKPALFRWFTAFFNDEKKAPIPLMTTGPKL